MRNIWSYTRERIKENEKRPNEHSSYSKGVEILLREIAWRVCPDLKKWTIPWWHFKTTTFVSLYLELQNKALDAANRHVMALASYCYCP